MAKWNPSSKVNQSHLLTILRRGGNEYLDIVERLSHRAQKPNGPDGLNVTIIRDAIEQGYLATDAEAILFPSEENVNKAKVAAAEDAKATMIDNLLELGQQGAVNAMIQAGTVSAELVAGIEASRAAEEA